MSYLSWPYPPLWQTDTGKECEALGIELLLHKLAQELPKYTQDKVQIWKSIPVSFHREEKLESE